jgi:transposase
MDCYQADAAKQPRGVPRVNDRRVLNGAPWRDLPETFGPYAIGYNRFVRWRRAGVWGRIITHLPLPMMLLSR